MFMRGMAAAALLAAAGFAGGCANDGNLLGESLTTSSVETAKAPAVDPQCVALMSKIDALRKEGTPERIEKVSSGKTRTVSVKRESLQRITELDKANAEFQSRCSTLTPGQRAAAAAAPTPAPAEVAKAAAAEAATDGAKKAAVKTVSKSSGKTVTAAATKTATKAVEAKAQDTVVEAAKEKAAETAIKAAAQ